MPAVSRSQQRLFGMVHAAQKGKLKNPSPQVSRIAGSIKRKDAKDFASTKHKGLPKRKKTAELLAAESLFKGASQDLQGIPEHIRQQYNPLSLMSNTVHQTNDALDVPEFLNSIAPYANRMPGGLAGLAGLVGGAGATAGAGLMGAGIGGLMGTGAGALRGRPLAGMGRGVVRGGATGAGAALGGGLGMLAAHAAGAAPDLSALGGAAGAGLGGLAGYFGSGAMLGPPQDDTAKDEELNPKYAQLQKAAEALLPAIMADQMRAQQQMASLQQQKQPQPMSPTPGAQTPGQAAHPSGGFGMGGPQGAASALGPPVTHGKLGNGPGANSYAGGMAGGYKVAIEAQKPAMDVLEALPPKPAKPVLAKAPRHQSLRAAANGLFRKQSQAPSLFGGGAGAPGTGQTGMMKMPKPAAPSKPAMGGGASMFAGVPGMGQVQSMISGLTTPKMGPPKPPMAAAAPSPVPPPPPPQMQMPKMPAMPVSPAAGEMRMMDPQPSSQEGNWLGSLAGGYKPGPGVPSPAPALPKSQIDRMIPTTPPPASPYAGAAPEEDAFMQSQGNLPPPPAPSPAPASPYAGAEPAEDAFMQSQGDLPAPPPDPVAASPYAGLPPEEDAFVQSQGDLPTPEAPPTIPEGGARMQMISSQAPAPAAPPGRFSPQIATAQRALPALQQRLDEASASGNTRLMYQLQRRIDVANKQIQDLSARQMLGQEEYAPWLAGRGIENPEAAAARLFQPGGQMDEYQQMANAAAPQGPVVAAPPPPGIKAAAARLFTC